MDGNKFCFILFSDHVTAAHREHIVALRAAGLVWREVISLMRKNGCNVSERTVRQIWYNYKKCGSAQERKHSGRPRVCGERAERVVIRTARANRSASFNELSKSLTDVGLHLSRNTVARVLDRNGYARRGVCHRPTLNPRQKAARLAWARAHSTWQVCHWSRVVFSDEKIFQSISDRPGQRITRKSSERLLPICVRRVSRSGPQVHTWGCIGWRGAGPLKRVIGTLSAGRYQGNIIHDIALLGKNLCRKGRNKFIFQQDKAPAHWARTTREFLAREDVPLLPWPGNSPDLNPVEHAWSFVSRKLSSRPPPGNQELYWEAIQNEWRTIPLSTIRGWIASLPRRVQAVIDSGGDYTRY